MQIGSAMKYHIYHNARLCIIRECVPTVFCTMSTMANKSSVKGAPGWSANVFMAFSKVIYKCTQAVPPFSN